MIISALSNMQGFLTAWTLMATATAASWPRHLAKRSEPPEVDLLIPWIYGPEEAVLVGDIINLQCLVSTNYTDETSYSVNWIRGSGIQLSVNGTRPAHVSDRRIVPSKSASVDGIEYTLQIRDAKMSDGATYTCRVRELFYSFIQRPFNKV